MATIVSKVNKVEVTHTGDSKRVQVRVSPKSVKVVTGRGGPQAPNYGDSQRLYDDSKSTIDANYTFNAWHRSTDDTWHAVRYALATGLLDGIATGAGAIPADLKILTYS